MLFIILYALLQLGSVQTFVVQKVASKLSKELNTKVTVKRVKLRFLNRAVLEGLMVEDHSKDTLLYAGSAKADVNDWFIFKDKISLDDIQLDNAIVNLNRSDSVWNYQFLIDYFSSPSSGKKKQNDIEINLKKAHFNNIRFNKIDKWVGQNMIVSLQKMDLAVDSINFNKGKIHIGELVMHRPVFSQYDYEGNRPPKPNMTNVLVKIPVVNAFKWNNDGLVVSAKDFKIIDGRFINDKYTQRKPFENSFDGLHIDFNAINADFKNLYFRDDTLTANIKLNAKERGGLLVRKLHSDFRFTPDMMEFRNLDLQTNKSSLGNYFSMHYKSFNSDMGSFISNVVMDANFTPSIIHSDDIAIFAPALKKWNRVFELSGKANGTVENFSTYYMKLKTGNTYLDGDLTMRGLPDINNTFINFKSRNSYTNYNDIAIVAPEVKKINEVDIRGLGTVKFKGNFSGFINDFLVAGNLNTNMGNLTVDMKIKTPTAQNPVTYKGYLKTDGFNVGRFAKLKDIGIVALEGNVDGEGLTLDDLNTSFKGKAKRFDYNNYSYQNIDIDGSFVKQIFKGKFKVDDPNVKIKEFAGEFNLGKKDKIFNLNANVQNVNLRKLGLVKKDMILSGLFNLNFTGNNIDEFLGSAKIYHATLHADGKRLSFDSLLLVSQLVGDKKLLTLKSNEFDIELAGNFKVMELPDAFKYFLSNYYPAYIGRPNKRLSKQDFTFSIKTNNADEYIRLIHPKLKGFDYANVSGKLTLSSNELLINADIPEFSYDGKTFTGLVLEGNGNIDTLYAKINTANVKISDSLQFPDSKLTLTAHNDVTELHLKTNASKTLNDAELNAIVNTYPDGLSVNFLPSSFVINDKRWTLEKEGELSFRNKIAHASKIKFVSGDQQIIIDTELDDVTDKQNVLADLRNVIIDDISPFFLTNPSLKGKLTGQAIIRDPFNNLYAEFKGVTDSFKLNDKLIGQVNLAGDVNSKTGLISFRANSTGENNFNGNGSYNFKDSSESPLLVNLNTDKFNLNILEPFLSTVFSKLDGNATGTLTFSGGSKKKNLVGRVNISKGDFTVAYTQVHYMVENQTLNFGEGFIDFGRIEIKDTLNNTGLVRGRMYHNFFDDLRFDGVRMESPKMVLLNTTKKDNSQFYGYAIGSALMTIEGPLTNLVMNINGEPSITDTSHIVLPTGETKEAGTIDYIDFIQFGKEMEADIRTNENTNILVNLNLVANPAVTIDVILDEATGDIISGRGNGKLNMRVGTDEPLTMRGRYDLTQGEYTFNFQTFLRKPFTLNQGSITWNGDPYEAILNIDAEYFAKNVDMSGLILDNEGIPRKEDITILSHITGTLSRPEISFDLKLPETSELNRDYLIVKKLADLKTDDDLMNKQVASLLLLNTFISENQNVLSYNSGIAIASNTLGGIMSNWLTDIFNRELERATNGVISTYIDINPTLDLQGAASILQANIRAGIKLFLSDRIKMTVGGNLEYNNPYAIALSKRGLLTPDITIEWILNKDGSIRVVGFNRTSFDIASGNRNRSGIQLSYRKGFDRIGDIFKSKKQVIYEDSLRRQKRAVD